MKKYYIICPDGSSIFVQPYPLEFCMHCLVKLLDVSDDKYMLLRFAEPSEFPAVQADSAIAAVERIPLLESPKQ